MTDNPKRPDTEVTDMATLTALVHEEDGLFVATCQEVGTTSQGATREEAIANLREATQLYLEEFPTHFGEATAATFEVDAPAA